MFEANIKPEMEAFDIGFIRQGAKLVEQGLVKQPPHFQLVMGIDGGIPASPDNLLHMCRQLPQDASFCVAGIGRCQLSMTGMAIVLGGHVRVGLEDNIHFAKDKLAPNEEFVARTRRIAEMLQREVATPEETRKILRLQVEPR